MMTYSNLILIPLMFASSHCISPAKSSSSEENPKSTEMSINTLTAAEKAEGWQLLFDGKSMDGWHSYGEDNAGKAWKVVDGVMMLDNSNKVGNKIVGGGDIVTAEEFENYELSLEWNISDCGNSGIMFNVIESSEYKRPYLTGPEMQILDNTCHPDAKIETHRAGDLYDMIACSEETVKPAGEWNHVLIKINQGKTEFWLNDVQVVSFEMWTPEWDQMVSESKFKDMADFGKARKGHIVLQDHGDLVHFRNIKIKPL